MKVNEIRVTKNYSESTEKLLKGFKYSKIFYGVGLVYSENVELKTKEHIKEIDFSIFFYEENIIKVFFEIEKIF